MDDAFAAISPTPLQRHEAKLAREMVLSLRSSLINSVANELGAGNDREPAPRVIRGVIEAHGYPVTRQIVIDVQKTLRARYGERWANAKPKKFIRGYVSDGDEAMWEALRGVYGVDNSALLSILLRTFVAATQTRRIDYIDVPSIGQRLTDDDLRCLARALDFKATIPLTT